MIKKEKGSTIVEVLTVISIIGILVLLLIPKFQSYIKQAKIAQIKANVKTSELVYDSYSLLKHDYKTKFKKVSNESLSSYLENGHIYDKHGVVSELNLNSTFYYLDRNLHIEKSSFVDTSLDGSFIVDYEGTIYYIEGSVSTLENEDNVVDSSVSIFNKIDFNKVVIDSSTEFSFINLSSADAPVVIDDEIFGVNYFDTTSIYVFDIKDRLNPVGEIKVKINNNYDLTGIAVDNEYIYFSTYQSNKIVKYPIKEF